MKKRLLMLFCTLLAMSFLASCAGAPAAATGGTNPEKTLPAENPALPASLEKEALSLEEAYAKAMALHEADPEQYRDLCELQPETGEIVWVDGQYYQSYICACGTCNLRYIFIHQSEYKMSAIWDWLPIGTRNVYSLELLGWIDEGYR